MTRMKQSLSNVDSTLTAIEMQLIRIADVLERMERLGRIFVTPLKLVGIRG